MAHTAETCSRE